MNLTILLAALAQFAVIRIIAAFGFGLVTVVGVVSVVDQVETYVESSLAGMPQAMLQLASLAGVFDAFAMVLGAASFCVSYYLLTKATAFRFNPAAP